MRRVLAYHTILTAYGFWLPNDPRGSWSEFVRAWELFAYGGPATKTDERRSLAHDPHDVELRMRTKEHLVREPVKFNGLQARAIAQGFSDYCRRAGLIIYACAILPKHVHLVIQRHTCSIEQVARLLKGAATSEMTREGLHPFKDDPFENGRLPTPWTRHSWSVFLDDEETILKAIDYTNGNPIREGRKAQHWKFVTPFTGL